MRSVRATKSGLNRALQQKINAKYNDEHAHECLEWMHDMINSHLLPGEAPVSFSTSGNRKSFSDVLHNGVVLARMCNVLIPGIISTRKYRNHPRIPFQQMELIELFINTAKEFGIPDHACFQTVDLYEDQNLFQVIICLQSCGRKAMLRGMKGFGPKEAQANPRKFSEEQLRAGDTVIGLQMGTNQGASQTGMIFGKHRMIID